MSRKGKEPNNPIRPINFVLWIPRGICVTVAIVVAGGLFHVYSNGKKAFDSTLTAERMRLSKQVSAQGDVQFSKYKFLKSIWARDEKSEGGESKKEFLLWESLPGLNAEISKDKDDIEMLSCEKKSEKGWSQDKINKTNAWCSLIGNNVDAIEAKNINKSYIRQVVNRNDEIIQEGNEELFDLPPYDFWEGIQEFPDTKISKNGEYILSIYPSIQEGMSKFMSDNNMVGSVFAYRPSNGDIYCMASTPGWTEREKKNGEEVPKKGAHLNANFSSFTPGSTMKPITLLLMKDQGIDLDTLKFTVQQEESGRTADSHILEDGKFAHCAGYHGAKEQSASEGLGNSCNSFFAMSAEMLDLEKAKQTLESMDFYVEKYMGEPKHRRNRIRAINKIPYNQSILPLERTMKHSFRNVENFIGEGNLLVSPIDMAVLTALFGKLSADINSKVYFPRIWLPADETKQNEGFRELLLTEKHSTENEHIAKLSDFISKRESEHVVKLSDFVSTRRESIAEIGRIWKKASKEHYRNRNATWPENKHLDKGNLTEWSQWIDMAKTGTVDKRPDETDPRFGECLKEKKVEVNGKNEKRCTEKYKAEHRTQRTFALYSEELDLAAYIVIENYSGVHAGNSKIRLNSTSMKLTELVAKALGKTLDPEKQKIEDEQWKRFNGTYNQKKAATGQKPKKAAKPKKNTKNNKKGKKAR